MEGGGCAQAIDLRAVAIGMSVCYGTVNLRNCQELDGPLSAYAKNPPPSTVVGRMVVLSVVIGTGA